MIPQKISWLSLPKYIYWEWSEYGFIIFHTDTPIRLVNHFPSLKTLNKKQPRPFFQTILDYNFCKLKRHAYFVANNHPGNPKLFIQVTSSLNWNHINSKLLAILSINHCYFSLHSIENKWNVLEVYESSPFNKSTHLIHP